MLQCAKSQVAVDLLDKQEQVFEPSEDVRAHFT